MCGSYHFEHARSTRLGFSPQIVVHLDHMGDFVGREERLGQVPRGRQASCVMRRYARVLALTTSVFQTQPNLKCLCDEAIKLNTNVVVVSKPDLKRQGKVKCRQICHGGIDHTYRCNTFSFLDGRCKMGSRARRPLLVYCMEWCN